MSSITWSTDISSSISFWPGTNFITNETTKQAWDDYSFIDGLSDEYINANKIHKESIIEELPHLYIDNPPGYDNTPFYGISDIDTDKRVLGLVSNGAKEYLNQADTDKPDRIFFFFWFIWY